MLGASFLFAVMGYGVKLLAQTLPSVEIVFFRNIFGIALILAAFVKSPPQNPGGHPWLLIWRGVIGSLSLLLVFYNMAHMTLADAVTFTRTSPIFTAVFAWWLLKERLENKAWLAIGIGFLGILFVVKPTGDFPLKLAITGILSGIGAGLAYTAVRELRQYYDSRTIVLSFVLFGTVIPFFCMVLAEFVRLPMLDFALMPFVWPDLSAWGLIAIVGVVATLSQIWMTKAYTLTKAGIVGAVSYTNILFAALIGLFIGEGLPDLWATLGILLIISGGVLVSRVKNRG